MARHPKISLGRLGTGRRPKNSGLTGVELLPRGNGLVEHYSRDFSGRREGLKKLLDGSFWSEPRWLTTLEFMIPKSIREPWFGDLQEDRYRMAAAGKSRTAIAFASSMQLALLLFHWILSLIKDLSGFLK